jgi:RHS repeat-associated protein
VDGINDEVLMDLVQYDVDNLITQLDYGNDLQATFSYDARDRISTMDVKNGTTSYLILDYTLDNNSNITQLANGWRDTTSTWHSETESYSYDGLDRLTSASCTSWSHTYAYDKVGNRASKDSVTYTINTVNEVTSLSDGTSFTYDANGNRTQKTKGTDTWVYTYDHANRVSKAEKNSATLGQYVYDGDGRRIQVTENSTTTTYICSGVTVLYEETMTGTADYIYGPKGLLGKRTTVNQESNTFYCHVDHLGSNRLVTDENKNIVAAISYHPFGEPTIEEGSEHYLFTGKEKDATGLYYYGARYYDAELGRFITRDPLNGISANPQSLNRYTYCLNNPLKYTDPTGLVEKKFSREGGVTGGSGSEPEKEEEATEDVEIIGRHDFRGAYFENEDGDGFIYLESDIAKCGNVGVAIGSLHIPQSGKDLDHGLVIITYDNSGEVEDVQFISFTKLLVETTEKNEKPGALGFLLSSLNRKGLKSEFKKALQGLEDICDEKQLKCLVGGGLGGGAAILVGSKKVGGLALGAAAGPVGTAIAAGVLVYITSRTGYWYNNESSVNDVERMI